MLLSKNVLEVSTTIVENVPSVICALESRRPRDRRDVYSSDWDDCLRKFLHLEISSIKNLNVSLSGSQFTRRSFSQPAGKSEHVLNNKRDLRPMSFSPDHLLGGRLSAKSPSDENFLSGALSTNCRRVCRRRRSCTWRWVSR